MGDALEIQTTSVGASEVEEWCMLPRTTFDPYFSHADAGYRSP